MTEQERAAISTAREKLMSQWATNEGLRDAAEDALDTLGKLLAATAAPPEPQLELPDDEAVLKEVLVEIGRRFPSTPLAPVRATVYRTLGIVGRSALASRPDQLASQPSGGVIVGAAIAWRLNQADAHRMTLERAVDEYLRAREGEP